MLAKLQIWILNRRFRGPVAGSDSNLDLCFSRLVAKSASASHQTSRQARSTL